MCGMTRSNVTQFAPMELAFYTHSKSRFHNDMRECDLTTHYCNTLLQHTTAKHYSNVARLIHMWHAEAYVTCLTHAQRILTD